MNAKMILKRVTYLSVLLMFLHSSIINAKEEARSGPKDWYWFLGQKVKEAKETARDVRIITEGLTELAKLGREPEIVEGLVLLEKARLKGLSILEPYEEEGVLYKGPDFKVTEKTEEKGVLNVRTVTIASDAGQILSEQKMVADELIVGLSSYEDAKALTSGGGLSIAEAPPSGDGVYRLRIEDERRVEEALAYIGIEGNNIIKDQSLSGAVGTIKFLEPNGIVGIEGRTLGLPNDPEFWNQWGLHNVGQKLPVGDKRYDVPKGTSDVDIDGPEAHDIFKGEKNIVIAIIDTGCDYNHPDLSANIWKNPGEVPGNNYDDDGNGLIDDIYGWDFHNDDNDPMDDHRHGTHLSGIIAASSDNAKGISGIMHKAALMLIKVLNAEANGTWYDAAQGIRYALNEGASVINISWSGAQESEVLKEAIKEAQRRGAIVVCSAGSGEAGGKDIDKEPVYPASFVTDNIITVCAIDATDRVAGFTNTGILSVDLGAPGVQILSANGDWEKEGQEDYIWGEWGTSASAAYVTGAVGLLRSLVPTATAEEVKQAILDSVFRTPALNGKTLTGGRLNLYDALNLLTEGTKVYIEKTEVDGDAIMSPGETVGLSITLKNVGQEGAAGIKGTLSVDKEGITLRRATIGYGDIPPGMKVTRTYILNIDDNFVTPDMATFTFDIVDRDGNSSKRRFSEPIYTLNKIKGKVLDYITKAPLYGATISYEAAFDYEPPYFGEVKTDQQGAYILENLKDGRYKIKAAYTGMVDSDWVEVSIPPSVENLDFLMGQGAKIEYGPKRFEVNVAAGMKLNETLSIKNIGAPDLRYYISSREKVGTSAEEEYEVVSKIPAPPEGTLAGMCFDGEYLWVAKNSVSIKFFRTLDAANTIYKIDPKDGRILKKVFLKDDVTVGGIEWVDGRLWYVDRTQKQEKEGDITYSYFTLNRIDPNSSSSSGDLGAEDNQTQSLVNRVKALLSKLLNKGVVINAPPVEKTIKMRYASAPWGLAWDGEKFWVLETGSIDRIWHVDPNKDYPRGELPPYIRKGTWASPIRYHSSGFFYWFSSYSYDLAWDGKYLWSTDYKPRDGEQNIMNCDPMTFDKDDITTPKRHYGVTGPGKEHMAIAYDGMMIWVSGIKDGRWLYQLDLARIDWLTAEPYKGQARPDETHDIKLTFDSMNFKPFTDHEAVLKLLTNDKENYVVNIPVLMNVYYGPGLKFHSYDIDDDRQGSSYGDADTYPEAGETVEMKVTLVNEGLEQSDAKGVIAKLSTNDKYITLIDDLEEFGDIPGKGGQGASKGSYIFSISDGTPQGHRARLRLEISDGAGHTWTDDIFLTIKQTSYVSGVVTDAKTGLFVSGARVVAEGPVIREGITRADGTYSIFGLYDGVYLVQALDKNYLPSAPKRAIVPPSKEGLNFILRRPIIGVEPTELSADVPKDGRVHQTLTISNMLGSADLTFKIAAEPVIETGAGPGALGAQVIASPDTEGVGAKQSQEIASSALTSSMSRPPRNDGRDGPPRNDGWKTSARNDGAAVLTNGELVRQMQAMRDKSRKGLNPELADKINAEPDGRFNVLVEMMAETEGLPEMADRGDKEGIIRALQATAQTSQAGVKAMLNSAVADDNSITYRAFWIANVINIRNAPKELIEQIAQREDVREVYEEGIVQLDPPIETTKQPPVGNLEWNIDRVKANKAWEMGVDGRGVLIGSIDTGVEATHPDLKGKIRPENSWFDPVYGEKSPKDVYGHGTHTIGTMLGGNADGTHIGVAPKATYISANGFSYGGSGSWANLIACGEWMMDPDKNPSTDDAPVVICNSWGGGKSDKSYWDTVTAWVAAGIFPEFSQGNSGPSEGSANAPGNYPHSFGVGATTPKDEIASFSSRGPSYFDNVIKPDISAPGTEIKSSFPGGKYREWQGTSMAGPHVAATVALMKQANPFLTIDETRKKLEETARDLGEAGKDNTYGAGLLNAYEAVKKAGVGWLRFEPKEGTVGEGKSMEVKVTYNALGLEKKTHKAKVSIFNNDPVRPEVEIPATMNIVSGASIIYNSFIVDDSPQGDGDNAPEPGETVKMKLTLKNLGTDAADTTGVKAWLSTDAPYITITDNYEEFGDMKSGASAESIEDYDFSISSNAPDGHIATFNLMIQDDKGGVWKDSFSIPCAMPQRSKAGLLTQRPVMA